jgi:hypothetical protein
VSLPEPSCTQGNPGVGQAVAFELLIGGVEHPAQVICAVPAVEQLASRMYEFVQRTILLACTRVIVSIAPYEILMAG